MPRKLYRHDVRRKTVALVNAAEVLEDDFLRSIYLIALEHIDEQIRTRRRRFNPPVLRLPKDAEIERLRTGISAGKAACKWE